MSDEVRIGETGLPPEVNDKLGDFVDWVDQNYEIDQGATAMFWSMAHYLHSTGVIKEKK